MANFAPRVISHHLLRFPGLFGLLRMAHKGVSLFTEPQQYAVGKAISAEGGTYSHKAR